MQSATSESENKGFNPRTWFEGTLRETDVAAFKAVATNLAAALRPIDHYARINSAAQTKGEGATDWASLLDTENTCTALYRISLGIMHPLAGEIKSKLEHIQSTISHMRSASLTNDDIENFYSAMNAANQTGGFWLWLAFQQPEQGRGCSR